MATVKDSIKESLVGTKQEPGLSVQIRQNFLRKAKSDEGTGELYMTEKEFVDAIAPKDEDYVSSSCSCGPSPVFLSEDLTYGANLTNVFNLIAQNQTRTVRNTLQSRRPQEHRTNWPVRMGRLRTPSRKARCGVRDRISPLRCRWTRGHQVRQLREAVQLE
jgi:hypothetical protein